MKLYLVVYFTAIFIGCNKNNADAQGNTAASANSIISYVTDTTDFPNPERGFYRYSATHATNYVPLNVNELKDYRSGIGLSTGAYTVLSTLVFRYFVLDGFNNAPLSTALLNNIQLDFDIARQAGVKLIPRFTYTITSNAGSCAEGFICTPYGDASKTVALNHIRQLQPLLTSNADVIACVQMGFIGTWGENYYTDFFGDASQNAGQGKLLDNNWQDRFEVLQALLNALPKDRMVQVRYPQFKQRFVYGVNAAVNSAALTGTEAFNESDKARIAFHNDCFLSGTDDTGTYEDYGNSSTPRKGGDTVITALRTYKKQDSRYVAIGGETCMDTYSPQNDCESAGHAQTEMAEMHYSFLNADYNTAVNNDWQTGGCMSSIKIKLGYRFVLKNASFPKKAMPGTAINIVINLDNIGYASPFNARPVQLLLRNKITGLINKFGLTTDIRKWYSGAVKLEQVITLPADIAPGRYELLLNIPDKYAAISNRSEYSIRLASQDVWEDATGYNKLNHILVIQ